MNRSISLKFNLLIVFSFLGFQFQGYSMFEGFRASNLWKNVQDAENRKRPKTALKHLQKIVELTKDQDGLEGHYIKALAKTALNEAHIQGKKPEEKLRIIEQALQDASDDTRPILKTIAALWYWHYYESNRWRFSQRTTTAGLDEKDITKWDSAKVFDAAGKLFEEALESSEDLKKLPLKNLQPIVERGTLDWKYCDTVYEFLLRTMMNFYDTASQVLPKPTNAFVIESYSDALAPRDEFLKYEPETTDKDSDLYKSLKAYQELLSFLKEEGRKEALVNADIERLQWLNQKAVGGTKKEILELRYAQIADNDKDVAESSLARYYQAQLVMARGDLVLARELALKGRGAYYGSDGAKLCDNLIMTIEQKAYSVKTEYSMNSFNSEAHLTYKNISKVHVRIYKGQWDRFLKEQYGHPNDYLEDHEIEALLRTTPVAEFNQELEPANDYKNREARINLPNLDYGFYRVFISEDSAFRKKNQNQVVHAGYWFTNTVVLMRNLKSKIQGLLVHGENGSPLQNVDVDVFYRKQDGWYTKDSTIRSNKEGIFEMEQANRERWANYVFVARSRTSGDVMFHQAQNFGYESDRGSSDQIQFFTDRAIYRPGQTIHFKGICISANHRALQYNVGKCSRVGVTLRDANGQEVAKEIFQPNEFGSFSGTFTTPRDVLTGRMTLVARNPYGNTSFRVEEYKRPKFEVKLESLAKEFRLNEEVKVPGTAMSYSGVTIADAKVKYRVVRTVRMPWWWRWGNPHSGSQEIAYGELKTKDDGSFEIPFQAKPDLSVDPETRPIFEYSIQVDVVDPTGETRSDETVVRVGYVSLDARIHTSEWLESGKEVALRVSTKTLGGQAVDNNGVLEVYRLNQPVKPMRKPSRQSYGYWHWRSQSDDDKSEKDLSDYNNWGLGDLQEKLNYSTKSGQAKLDVSLDEGSYRVVLKTKDSFGTEVEVSRSFLVVPSRGNDFPIKIPSLFLMESSKVEVGGEVNAIWASGYENAVAHVSFLREQEVLNAYWTKPSQGLHRIKFPVNEFLRGGFTLQVLFVHENQVYEYNRYIDVPYSNKRLSLSFETFRSKLRPNEKETWSVLVKGPDAQAFAAEMVATLYDASLDSFVEHSYQDFQNMFFKDGTAPSYNNNVFLKTLQSWFSRYGYPHNHVDRSMPSFPWDINNGFVQLFPFIDRRMRMMSKSMAFASAPMGNGAPEMLMEDDSAGFAAESSMLDQSASRSAPGSLEKKESADSEDQAPKEKKKEVTVRSNLSETAFFYPHLISQEDGSVKIEFQMPEALTRWNFLAMAHGKGMESALLRESIVTQKELMVEPNSPRFLRQGDELHFTAKVSNMSDELQSGEASLELINPMNDEVVSANWIQSDFNQDFAIKPGRSAVMSWKLKVPEVSYPVLYRVRASTSKFSDGEENILPVLSKRILVRESKPLWVRGPSQRSFKFDKLIESAQSETLTHEKLVLQMTSNPAWYVVMALPYLDEYPYECSEQIFNRLYANQLGVKIVKDNPRIQRIFEMWKGSDTLKSPLQKNQDLKAVMLQETPWVVEAQSEEKSRQKVANFFGRNKMQMELKNSFEILQKRQLSNGSWPWFPGGKPNQYITMYLVTGFGRLRDMGVDIDVSLATKALSYLDAWMQERYDWIKTHGHLNQNNYSNTIAMYLYGRSFFLNEQPVARQYQTALNYFLDQAKEYWPKLDNRMGEGHTVLGCARFGRKDVVDEIMVSLRERALHDEEMGMYWADQEFSYWWYRAPIETHSLMIEVFQDFGTQEEVDTLQVWLLKQKQTQDWKTTKATADAIYALLRRGEDLLSRDDIVKVELGGVEVDPGKVEAGTGFYEKRFTKEEIRSQMGEISVIKEEKGISWGGLFWQYFEDIDKITPHKTPLELEKQLFIRKYTDRGPVIEPYSKVGAKVGDTMVVRVVIRVDRDMEYVHLKDMRGSGTEPVNVLSHYKYQDGLAYYESTKDTASHFFIDYLPKGTYVFEYELKVFHKGVYQSGMAEIQCMYAPEFNSHSQSFEIRVEE